MKRLLAVMAVLVLLAAGCGDDDDTDTTGGATTSTTEAAAGEETTLNVENAAANEKTFTAPAEISGGVVTMTFKNNGKLVHEAGLVQIGDRSEEDAIREFTPVVTEEGSPIPAFLEANGGINEVPAGQSATSTLTLGPGRYLIICSLDDNASLPDEQQEQQEEGPELPPHFQQGMRKLLTVTGGSAQPSALPQGDGTVVAKDYTFDVPTNLTPGKKQLVFRNDGPGQIHHGIFFKFPAGTDEAAARRAFEAFAQAEQQGGPPPPGTPEPEEAGYSSVFSPGRAGTFELEVESGRTYAVLCFIQDRSGSPPHAFSKGMMKFFTVR